MIPEQKVSRRRFMGGAAAALGYLGLRPGSALATEIARGKRKRR